MPPKQLVSPSAQRIVLELNPIAVGPLDTHQLTGAVPMIVPTALPVRQLLLHEIALPIIAVASAITPSQQSATRSAVAVLLGGSAKQVTHRIGLPDVLASVGVAGLNEVALGVGCCPAACP